MGHCISRESLWDDVRVTTGPIAVRSGQGQRRSFAGQRGHAEGFEVWYVP